MSNKTLLLTYCFPPMGTPEAFLCAKLLGNLPDSEVTVHTIGAWKPWMNRDQSLVQYSSDRFSKINRFTVPGILQKFPLVKQDLKKSHSKKDVPVIRSLKILAIRILSPLFKIPDALRVFNRSLLADVLKQHWEFNNLVTWSQWHSIHLVGIKLKKTFADTLHWTAYFGDPWIESPYSTNPRIVELINARLQSKVFAMADILIFPTAEMRELALSKYDPSIQAKGKVLGHSFDPILYPKRGETRTSEKYTFRYLGQFYGIRTPEIIYDSLAELFKRRPLLLSSVQIEIIGDNSPLTIGYESFLTLPQGVVTFLPQVNYLESLRLMTDADCLISIDAPAKTNVFLSAKVIDYIGSGTPIVAFTPPGTTREIVQEYGGWVANSNDANEGSIALEAAITWLSKNRTSAFGNNEIRSQYESKKVAGNLRALML